jgi:molybdopterin converting factor subunit 1
MRVTVRLFARARDLAGAEALTVELPAGATVADLRRRLLEERPALGPLLPRCAVAVGGDFAEETRALADGEEAAVLPPVSGGEGGASRPA